MRRHRSLDEELVWGHVIIVAAGVLLTRLVATVLTAWTGIVEP